MSNFKTDIKEVINVILTQSPFFASKLVVTPQLADNSIETACTNGIDIKYNEEFFNSLTFKQRITLVAHELAHIVFCHHLRMYGRDCESWNIATDHAINLLLYKMGFTPLDNWLCDFAFEGMSAENIYDIVHAQPKEEKEKQAKQSEGSGGSVKAPEKNGQPMTKEENQNALEEGKKDLEKAMQSVQRQINGVERSESLNDAEKQRKIEKAGQGIAEFREQLSEIVDSQIPWEYIVNRFLNDLQQNDYNMMVPDEDFLTSCDYLMPNLESIEFGNVGLVLDVSGSLSKLSKQLASEVFHCLELLGKKSLDVFYVSHFYHGMKRIESEQDIETVRGGGTDFRSFFNTHLEQDNDGLEGLIFVTDGIVSNCDQWQAPDCPVLWVMTRKNTSFENRVPFGECIQMHDTI
jgi:predicted metal-dependent peptidase